MERSELLNDIHFSYPVRRRCEEVEMANGTIG
jgi:hypothetical protein